MSLSQCTNVESVRMSLSSMTQFARTARCLEVFHSTLDIHWKDSAEGETLAESKESILTVGRPQTEPENKTMI